MMRFLIAGLGSIGRRHLRNLQALGQTDILLYRTHSASLPDSELEGIPEFTGLAEALAQKPDAVIISNPTSAHISVALPASAAGCHLLIEKPISQDMAGMSELRANLARTGRQVLMGFHYRYHPVLCQVKTLLDSGQLGQPLSVHAHWGEYLPDWHPWEDYRRGYAARADLGGGVVLTLSHPLDYLRWLIGEVDAVSATLAHASLLELDVEDHADIALRFTRGCLGSVHLNYYQRPPAHWFEIITESGFIRWNNASGTAEIYSVARKDWQHLNPPVGFERNDLFLAEMAHFIKVCQGVQYSGCDLEDGIRALEIALAVHYSATVGSRLVPLA
jgi:predicted dehydrogenase